jgi:hypothetical protein
MPLDPSIPLQAKGVQLESPANQLNMMATAAKLNEYQRGVQEQNALRDLIKSGVDIKSPEARQKMYEISPEMGIKFEKSQAELNKANLETKKLTTEVDKNQYDQFKQRTADLIFNPSDNNIRAHLEDGVLKGMITPGQAQERLNTVLGMNLDQRKQYFTEQGVKAEERYRMAEQQRHNKVTEGIAGGHLTVAQQTLAAANNPELQATLSAAKAGGTETGKATAQAAIALPGAIATGEEAIRKVDELVGAAPVKNAEGKLISAGTKPHAGFGQAVGAGIPGLKYIPGTSVTDFNKRLEEIQGGAFLQAFNTLKGGGSITEAEGTKATQAINRMSTAQSEKEFNLAAREYQEVLRNGIARAKAKAAGGGGVPVGRGNSAPVVGGEIDFNSLK